MKTAFTKVLPIAIFLTIGVVSIGWAEFSQPIDEPAVSAPQGAVPVQTPMESPAKVEKPKAGTPRNLAGSKVWQVNEIESDGKNGGWKIYYNNNLPTVWHGTVHGKRITEVSVRRHGKTKVIYVGSKLTRTQVNNLIAEWAKKAGLASKSFVRAQNAQTLKKAKEYTDNATQPLEKRVSALERGQTNPEENQPTQKGSNQNPSSRTIWQDNPWLVLAVPFLLFVIAGCSVLIYRFYNRRMSR